MTKIKAITGKRERGHIVRRKKDREPKLMENPKKLMVLRGLKTSQITVDFLKHLYLLRKPDSLMMSKQNDIIPFENEVSLEFLGQRNDCSQFAFGSHNKKRPHNLILGRLFDGHLLDMAEFGIEDFISIAEFHASSTKRVGSKPLILFLGDKWENDEIFGKIKNLFIDIFRGEEIDKFDLSGIDHGIVFTALEDKILFRMYSFQLSDVGSSAAPSLELVQTAPSFSLNVRRTKFSSHELWKLACRRPKELKIKKVKNLSKNPLGDKTGRIHMEKQDLDQMKVRMTKALRNVKTKKTNSKEV
jgi:ribosome production factor 2